jgi:hypothetical protein
MGYVLKLVFSFVPSCLHRWVKCKTGRSMEKERTNRTSVNNLFPLTIDASHPRSKLKSKRNFRFLCTFTIYSKRAKGRDIRGSRFVVNKKKKKQGDVTWQNPLTFCNCNVFN